MAITTRIKSVLTAPLRWVGNRAMNTGLNYYHRIQGGRPMIHTNIGRGDGPKDLSDVVPQLTRWEEGGVEVNFDHTPSMEKSPSYNFSRIGWSSRQALQWYPHAITDIPLYLLPVIYWASTFTGVDFIPLISTAVYALLYFSGFSTTLTTYISSHKSMGDTFLGDLVSKEALLKNCGPGWVEGSAKAVARVGSGFAVTPSGGAKARLPGRVAFGLLWRFGASVLASLAGVAMMATNTELPFLSGTEYALTLFGWGANTVFPALNAFLVGYGIHSHHGFNEHGLFRSGWHYLWDEVKNPFTGAK